MIGSELKAVMERFGMDDAIVLVQTPDNEPVGPGKCKVSGLVVQIGTPCTLIFLVEP